MNTVEYFSERILLNSQNKVTSFILDVFFISDLIRFLSYTYLN